MSAMRHEFCDPQFWQSPWLDELPEDYFRRFGDYLADVFLPANMGTRAPREEWWRREFAIQLFIRMQQSHHILTPWIKEACDLKHARVLEIGCGSGSSTVPIAANSRSVTAVDISSISLDAARVRAELLGAGNIEWTLAEPLWLAANAIPWPVRLDKIDVVICYAVLEHLTIQERMHFLRSLWRDIAPRTKVVFFETPNRFAPMDWHSSDLLFAQILPDELVVEYYARSPRLQVRANHALPATDNLAREQRERLYRWGRGVSFHEFDLAIGLDQFRIINDGYSSIIKNHRDEGFGARSDFEEALAAAFQTNDGCVPRSFARPSLDLIIEKP